MDVINCVDIYKQLAFDHPLLKDHKLQRQPTYTPKAMRRTTKEDLIRAKAFLALNRSRPINPAILKADTHHAIVTTPNDPSQKIYGATTSISVYNLTDTSPQLSEAMLWLGTGVDGPYNSIEYGWAVDGFQNTGCYNAQCPGYVQVSQKRVMGEVNHPVTVFGSDVYAMEFKLFKDPNTSNWWLFENLGDQANEPVVYWPKELFPVMAESASVVQIGGKVNSPGGTPKPTPMGSVYYVKDDFTRTCYASNIQFVDSNYQFYDPKDVNMQVLADIPDIYRANYLGDASKDHPQRGYTLIFGGPGGWD